MDPIIGGALVAAGGSLLTNALGSWLGKKSSDNANSTNLQSVRETNEANTAMQDSVNRTNLQAVDRTNQANLALAKQQNDWNIDQWNRENEYNSPKAQVQRLIDAGINPLFGGVQGFQASPLQSAELANQVAPQAQASKNVAGQVSPYDYSGVIGAGSEAAQAFLAYQQGMNLEHQNKKLDQETNILSSDAAFRDAFNQGVLDLQNTQIHLNLSSERANDAKTNLSFYEIQQLQASCRNLDQSTAYLREQINNVISSTSLLNEQTFYQRILNQITPERLKAEIRKLYSDISVNDMNNLVSLENIDQIKAYIKNIRQHTDLMFSQQMLNSKQYNLTDMQLKVAGSQYMLNTQSAARLYLENDMYSVNNAIEKTTMLLQGVGSLLGGFGSFNRSSQMPGTSSQVPWLTPNMSYSNPSWARW